MDYNIILKYYWDIFLSHLCEFYPLDKFLIEKYQYELDWDSLSKNKVIDWDIEFMKKYESRLLWHELAWNEKILWTEDKIDTFKKRLDWYYLGRNINLPITDDFIIKYSKKIFVVETNPLLNENLINKHNLRILPADTLETQEIKSVSLNEIEPLLNNYIFHHNQKKVFEDVFMSIINRKGIEQIFNTKFDYSQRYYYFEPILKDISGLTPEFKIEGYNPFSKFVEDRPLINTSEIINLVNGSLQEGPDRIYEVPRFSTDSCYITLLVSENVKFILEQFKFPNHIYHEVNIKPKKLIISTKYFLLQIEHDSLLKDLEFSTQKYTYKFRDFKTRGFGIINQSILNYQEYKIIKESIDRKYRDMSFGAIISPESFRLHSDFDIYCYSNQQKFIVNQYLKDALEKHLPNQIAFKSAQLLNIKIDQHKYDSKSNVIINAKIDSKLN
jgi:hypothetical protein